MDLGKNIQQSIDVYFKNFGALFAAGLVAGLLTAVTLGILAGPLMGGFYLLVLKVMRGEKGEFSEIFAHFDKFTPTFITSLFCFAAMIVAGIIPILNIILGLVLNPLISFIWTMALIMILEKNIEPMNAIKEGIAMVKTNPLMIWLYSLSVTILSGIGVIACGIGVLITAPISPVGMAVAYKEMTAIPEIITETPNLNA